MPSKTRNRFDLIRFLDHLDVEIPSLRASRSWLSPTTSPPVAPTRYSGGWPTIRGGAFSSPEHTPRG
jgi:hypothetical protein